MRLKSLNIIKNIKPLYYFSHSLLLKKNGNIRIVVSYRELNKYTQQDHYPNPGVDELLYGLKNAKYHSKLDNN